jgi:hypothetical protein
MEGQLMALRSPKFDPNEMVICVESFGVSVNDEAGGCAAGVRLRGGHPKVVARPRFFISADSSFDEIEAQRLSLYEPGKAFRT